MIKTIHTREPIDRSRAQRWSRRERLYINKLGMFVYKEEIPNMPHHLFKKEAERIDALPENQNLPTFKELEEQHPEWYE